MNNTCNVIVVPGASNDVDGRLSAIAVSRANAALAEYRRQPGFKLLLTGGFGDHFNTTDQPHAHYVARHLLERGVDPGDILQFAESTNTIDDAFLARRILDGRSIGELRVVTSDFHQKRAELIFRQVFPTQNLVVLGPAAPLSPDERAKRNEHETRALRRIEQQGGVEHPQPGP